MKRTFFFLAFATFTFFVVGFYFETNDDLQCELLFKGLLSPEPISEIRVLFPYLSSCFSVLYELRPSFPIYALFVVASCLLFILLFSRYLGLSFLQNESFKDDPLTHLALFSLFLLHHLVMMQFSRFSLLIPFLCLLLLFKEDNKKLKILYLFLFVLYSLLRSQSLPLVLLLFALVLLVATFSRTSFKIPRFEVLCVSFSSLVVVASLYWHQHLYIHSDGFLSNDLPYIVDVVNNHSAYPLRTKGDSTTVDLVEHWLMGDRHWLNQEHLSRIAPGKLVSWYKIKLKYYDFLENRVVFLLTSKYLSVSLFLFLLGLKLYRHGKRAFFLYSFYLIAFMGLCGCITVLMKMPDHLAEPLLCILFLSCVFLLPKELNFTWREKRLLLLATLPFFVYTVWQYKDLGREGESYKLAWLEAEKDICGKEIIVGDYSLSRFSYYPVFAKTPFQSCNQHLIIGGWTGWLPETQEQIKHLTGNKDLSSLFVPHPQRVWLLSDGEEKIYQDLAAKAYGKNIRFQPYGHPGLHMQAVNMGWFFLEDQ